MVKYDPKILQKYAEKLYRDASFIVFVVTVIFAVIGVAVGMGLGGGLASAYVSPQNRLVGVWIVGGVGGLITGVIGFVIGQAMAFWYRLKAQLTLCQKQIELNTRAAARASQVPASFPEIHE